MKNISGVAIEVFENINMDDTSANKKRKIDGDSEVNAKTKNVYSCDQCEYTGSRTALHKHKQSKREGIRYPCDQCEYAATRQGDLKKHKNSKHEGIRFPCDQCEYSATVQDSLKKHKQSIHEGMLCCCLPTGMVIFHFYIFHFHFEFMFLESSFDLISTLSPGS